MRLERPLARRQTSPGTVPLARRRLVAVRKDALDKDIELSVEFEQR